MSLRRRSEGTPPKPIKWAYLSSAGHRARVQQPPSLAGLVTGAALVTGTILECSALFCPGTELNTSYGVTAGGEFMILLIVHIKAFWVTSLSVLCHS